MDWHLALQSIHCGLLSTNNSTVVYYSIKINVKQIHNCFRLICSFYSVCHSREEKKIQVENGHSLRQQPKQNKKIKEKTKVIWPTTSGILRKCVIKIEFPSSNALNHVPINKSSSTTWVETNWIKKKNILRRSSHQILVHLNSRLLRRE